MPDGTAVRTDEQRATDGFKAKEWRTRNRYTKTLLSQRTGFSVSSIDAFETGERRDGRPVDDQAFHRYRLCCAAVHAELDTFDWSDK